MNTYETMKHNLPEGATHYHNETEDHFFCWFKFADGNWFVQCPQVEENDWNICQFEHKRDGICEVSSKEPAYRYEKVKTVFSLERDLMHKGEYGEVNNDEFYPAFNEVELVSTLTKDKLYRRIEVTERELFIDAYASVFNTHMLLVEDVAGTLFDSGKFNLVNGKG